MHRQSCSMRCVRYDTEHVLQYVCVVCLVEGLCHFRVAGDVLQQLKQDVQSRVGHVTHCVLERPDDRIKDQLELGRRDRKERVEAIQVHCLKEYEEVRTVLGELFEVLKRKEWRWVSPFHKFRVYCKVIPC